MAPSTDEEEELLCLMAMSEEKAENVVRVQNEQNIPAERAHDVKCKDCGKFCMRNEGTWYYKTSNHCGHAEESTLLTVCPTLWGAFSCDNLLM